MGSLTQQGRRVDAPGGFRPVLGGQRMPLQDPAAQATKRAGSVVEEVGNVWNARAQQFAQERNAVEVSKAIAELDNIKRERIDPLLQLKGNEALEREGFERGIVDEADQIYQEAYDQVKAKLTNPDQIERFEIRYDSRRSDGMDKVVTHYANEHQVVKKAAFDAEYSQATTDIRVNVGDTAYFEDRVAQVKANYDELNPGTNNGAGTNYGA